MSSFFDHAFVRANNRFRRVIVSLAGVGTALVVMASSIAFPASAHSELLASAPENGSTVSDVSDVSLTFGEEIVGEYTTLRLANESGEEIELGAPTMDATNTVVTTRIIAAPIVDGTYALGYYIVSIDGHPIEGTITFVVSGSPAPAPAPVEPTDSVTPDPEPSVTETPIAVDGEVRLLVTSSGASNPEMTWVWVGTGVAAVAVLGAVSAVLLIALRRRRDSESTTK